jgi:hypothetical protein
VEHKYELQPVIFFNDRFFFFFCVSGESGGVQEDTTSLGDAPSFPISSGGQETEEFGDLVKDAATWLCLIGTSAKRMTSLASTAILHQSIVLEAPTEYRYLVESHPLPILPTRCKFRINGMTGLTWGKAFKKTTYSVRSVSRLHNGRILQNRS